MSQRNSLFAILMLGTLSACGSHVVEFSDGGVLPDGGQIDAGPVDAGHVDAGPDAGAVDAGHVDAGPADAGPVDAGPVDAGPTDAGPADAGPTDAGPTDAGPTDAGPTDAGPNLAPTVIANMPMDGAIGISLNPTITATFSEAMNPATISALTFTLHQGATALAGTVTWDGASNTATFAPSAPLQNDLVYTATLTTGAQDVAGAALVADDVWSFTAASAAPQVISSGCRSSDVSRPGQK
jgi:hypothetical protein